MKSPSGRKSNLIQIASLVLCLGLFLSACGQKTTESQPTATESSIQTEIPVLTSTPRPTATPTLPPLGMEGNPVIIGFINSQNDINRISAAEDIAFLIGQETGYAMETRIFADFSSMADAIVAGEIHLFWPDPLEYLYLSEQGLADVLLMTNHLGVFAYGVQFMTNESHDFTSYFDEETGQSNGSVIDALQQFAGTRPCFLSPDSLPGYHVPLGLLAETSTPTLSPVFVYDYSAIIRALYIEKICDFGVTYALVGDPRNAGDIIQDIPESQEVIDVIWQTDGVIPNISLSASPSLPLTIKVRLQEAFIDLSNPTEPIELLALISSALDYDVEALKVVTDDYYNSLRLILAPLELNLQTITTQSQISQ